MTPVMSHRIHWDDCTDIIRHFVSVMALVISLSIAPAVYVCTLQEIKSRLNSGNTCYSGRKITESLGNATVRGENRWKEQEGSAIVNSQSMYSITENIYCSQLSSVAILLQPGPNCSTSYNTRKGLCSLSLSLVSSFGLPLPPTCLLLTVNEARSYFASTIHSVQESFVFPLTVYECKG
jgi:hypothetical protein